MITLLAGGWRPFVTLPLVYEPPRRQGAQPGGCARLHVYDAQTTGMHWQIGKGGGFHYQIAERRGEALPVTVFLGGPPAAHPRRGRAAARERARDDAGVADCGGTPSDDERPRPAWLAGRRGVARSEKCLPVNGARRGPSVTTTWNCCTGGTTTRCFTCARSRRRRDAIYPATVVGKPRQEDFFIGDLLQGAVAALSTW